MPFLTMDIKFVSACQNSWVKTKVFRVCFQNCDIEILHRILDIGFVGVAANKKVSLEIRELDKEITTKTFPYTTRAKLTPEVVIEQCRDINNKPVEFTFHIFQ